MEQYVIKGGSPLVGEVSIAGAKNAALGILAAAIMTDEEVIIENNFYSARRIFDGVAVATARKCNAADESLDKSNCKILSL